MTRVAILILAVMFGPQPTTQTPPPQRCRLRAPAMAATGPDQPASLPKDIPKPQLIQMMRGFTMGLGVRCEHCHVGEGNDLSKFDFASDAKTEKVTARRMIGMAREINTKLLAGFPSGRDENTPAVTCYTCHRGEKKPLTARPPQ